MMIPRSDGSGGLLAAALSSKAHALGYTLTDINVGYKPGTSAVVGNGFGFTYDLADPPEAPSATIRFTWVMMLVGFIGGHGSLRRPKA
jgi:hypothetical protein